MYFLFVCVCQYAFVFVHVEDRRQSWVLPFTSFFKPAFLTVLESTRVGWLTNEPKRSLSLPFQPSNVCLTFLLEFCKIQLSPACLQSMHFTYLYNLIKYFWILYHRSVRENICIKLKCEVCELPCVGY